MLATSLVDLGVVGGIVFLAIVLIFLTRPLRIHVTVRHESDDSSDVRDEDPKGDG